VLSILTVYCFDRELMEFSNTQNKCPQAKLRSSAQSTLSFHLTWSVTLSRIQNFAWGTAFVNLWGGGNASLNVANTCLWWWTLYFNFLSCIP